HEVAHQWWGQAVGWKNYHEQWLSEGFAQYFAALYAQQRRGDEAFQQMLRQFRRWALDMSDQGPISLGYRLGQMRGDRRVFRDLIFDLPVTVTLAYSNGRTADVVVAITDKFVEQRIPTDGPVRSVRINRDGAALAEFEEAGQ